MIELNPITTLCVACVLYLLGQFIVNHISALKRICIPAPVIGGLLFAVLVAVLDSTNIITIKLNAQDLQDFFMLVFFTTIGLGASMKLLRLGGKVLIIYLMFCGVLAIGQNIIGVSLAKLLHIDPLLGLTAGSMSMEGGHGNAAAYGKTIQDMGIDSGLTAALAAATLGLVAGGLIGGPVVNFLINKFNLKPHDANATEKDYGQLEQNKRLHERFGSPQLFLIQFTIIVICMAIGTYIGNTFSDLTGLNIPIYTGAMIIAVIVRNIFEYSNVQMLDLKLIDNIGDVALSLFLSIALMSIQLTDIYHLAIPLIIIVLVQVVFIILFSVFIAFWGLGKDYDAAVMVGGFIGHGLGATPNAMANLEAVTKKHGPSPKAYLVVPIVGAFLVDLVGFPVILAFINIFA